MRRRPVAGSVACLGDGWYLGWWPPGGAALLGAVVASGPLRGVFDALSAAGGRGDWPDRR